VYPALVKNGPATATSAVIYYLARVHVTPFIPSMLISIVLQHAITSTEKKSFIR
jgi:hypothetical protein